MLKNTLNLLILCAVLWQGILGAVADEDIEESSDVLIREKRVINRAQGEDVPVRIANVPYVVNIKKFNHVHCVGTILSPSTVITAAKCVELPVATYKVYSGSSSAVAGQRHTVQTKKLRFISQQYRAWDGVALITVLPHFVYNENTRNIRLYTGSFVSGTPATVSGWGFNCGMPRGTLHPFALRSIVVSIMNHQTCANNYRGRVQILDSEICTFDAHKSCGQTDVGAPLVINNELAGVHLFSGSFTTPTKPDIFALLQHPEFNQWIRANI